MNGPFGNRFPYTNFHEMNLDWVIQVAKDFLDNYSHIEEVIQEGEQVLIGKTDACVEVLDAKKVEIEGLLDQWYTDHSSDISGALRDALDDIQSALTAALGDISQAETNAETAFNQEAAAIVEAVLESIPDDYTALGTAVRALQYSAPVETNIVSLSNSGYFEQGYWDHAEKKTASNRIRSTFMYYIKQGATITITNPTLKIFYGRLNSPASLVYAQGGVFVDPSNEPTVITASFDGWLVLNAGKADNSSMTPSDWSGSIVIQNPVSTSTIMMERDALTSSSDDVHDIQENGIYYVSSTSVVNWPFDSTGILICWKSAATPGMYLAISYAGAMKYQYYSAGYSDWLDVETTSTVMQRTPNIGSTDDCNDYDSSAGCWYVSDAAASNWPFENTGILTVLKSGSSPLIQLASDYTNNLKIRYKSVGWTDWRSLIQENYHGAIISGDINDYTTPGEYTVTVPNNVTNWPSTLSGRLINFTNPNDTIRIVQVAVDYQLNTFIRYKSATFTSWRRFAQEPQEYTITVETDGTGDYTNVEDAIKYAMDEYFTNNHRYKSFRILVGAGTFDMSGIADMIAAETVPVSGLYLPPNCKLIGQGKNLTNLVWRYDGDSDDIMSNCSLLNGSYTAEIKDLSMTVKNLRYCIHSAQNHPDDFYGYDVTNPLINDTTLIYSGLKLVHEGFGEGISPTYAAPTPYGSGSWNGNRKIFTDCDFISQSFSGWLNHNRKGLTRPNYFYFDNCTFITKSVALDTTGAGANFISWASGPISDVIFKNCSMNKFISISIRTDEYGTPDGTSAYQISADNDLIVLDTTTNNVYLMDTWRTGEYITCTAGANITAYQPVSFNSLMSCRAYNAADPIWGIALNSASSGDPVTVKLSGRFIRSFITNTNFAYGKKISYDTDNSTWVEDNDTPMMIVTSNNILKLISKY